MYQFMNFIVNKDYEGNAFTPQDMARLVKVANMELFKIKMGLPEDYRPGQPISRIYPDMNQRITDETKFLKVFNPTAELISGLLEYPSDYFTALSLAYNYQRNIDGIPEFVRRKIIICTEDQLPDGWLKRPTMWNPVAVCRDNGIWIYPDTINTVEFSYIRYPAEPEFEYIEQLGYIEEDEANTVEFEWAEHLHMDLIRIMLSFIGVNLRDEQLLQYAELKKTQGV